MIGGNLRFEGLTKEELEELGGLEYKNLTALLWIVGRVGDFSPVMLKGANQYLDSITFYFSLLHSQLLLLTCQCHDGKIISKNLLYTKMYLLFGELSLWSRWQHSPDFLCPVICSLYSKSYCHIPIPAYHHKISPWSLSKRCILSPSSWLSLLSWQYCICE